MREHGSDKSEVEGVMVQDAPKTPLVEELPGTSIPQVRRTTMCAGVTAYIPLHRVLQKK